MFIIGLSVSILAMIGLAVKYCLTFKNKKSEMEVRQNEVPPASNVYNSDYE